jgi:hypothetical protein
MELEATVWLSCGHFQQFSPLLRGVEIVSMPLSCKGQFSLPFAKRAKDEHSAHCYFKKTTAKINVPNLPQKTREGRVNLFLGQPQRCNFNPAVR